MISFSSLKTIGSVPLHAWVPSHSLLPLTPAELDAHLLPPQSARRLHLPLCLQPYLLPSLKFAHPLIQAFLLPSAPVLGPCPPHLCLLLLGVVSTARGKRNGHLFAVLRLCKTVWPLERDLNLRVGVSKRNRIANHQPGEVERVPVRDRRRDGTSRGLGRLREAPFGFVLRAGLGLV
ncbi:hypothetical protein GSI_05595 [Ganoderma sinense ZZ0214-1]|uniref:Uncharacterized protein n=1 Tax=Ganoderma sinense ZZ0214-1 TaxID=1077348 RepID=A0A2G8SF10_9APHY|nr:hypothetical protein GSI_05595 [Ganoderma sinense ZZ0214-1]